MDSMPLPAGARLDAFKAVVFTADGDMRQALNNLQATHSGFGYVNQENVFKVCDQPHPQVISDCVAHSLAGPPSMFGIHFLDPVPLDYRRWRSSNYPLYERFAWNMIDSGIMLEPDAREPWFICEAHQTLDLDWLDQTAERSLRAALDAGT